MTTLTAPRAQAHRSERTLCALCGVPRRTTDFWLTHGIRIRLCAVHRSANFLRRAGGRTFCDRLRMIWTAHGAMSARRAAALAAHPQRLRSAGGRIDLPGSYAWPALRRQVEARFSSGEDPAVVIAQVRDQLRDSPVVCPSYRSMRRWFTQARWLTADGPDTPKVEPSAGHQWTPLTAPGWWWPQPASRAGPSIRITP